MPLTKPPKRIRKRSARVRFHTFDFAPLVLGNSRPRFSIALSGYAIACRAVGAWCVNCQNQNFQNCGIHRISGIARAQVLHSENSEILKILILTMMGASNSSALNTFRQTQEAQAWIWCRPYRAPFARWPINQGLASLAT
jgi:hypothetical protein